MPATLLRISSESESCADATLWGALLKLVADPDLCGNLFLWRQRQPFFYDRETFSERATLNFTSSAHLHRACATIPPLKKKCMSLECRGLFSVMRSWCQQSFARVFLSLSQPYVNVIAPLPGTQTSRWACSNGHLRETDFVIGWRHLRRINASKYNSGVKGQ